MSPLRARARPVDPALDHDVRVAELVVVRQHDPVDGDEVLGDGLLAAGLAVAKHQVSLPRRPVVQSAKKIRRSLRKRYALKLNFKFMIFKLVLYY